MTPSKKLTQTTLAIEIITGITIVISILCLGYYKSLYFDGYFADGPFQLLNALRRISDGQIMGKDFNFFHGVGTLFIHLPVYLMFGKNLFSSELARQVISPLLFVIINYLFLFVITKNRKLSISGSLLMLFLSKSYKAVFDPVNSMLGVRSFVIFIIVLYIVKFLQRKQHAVMNILIYFVLGLLLGSAIFVSTESGFAAILAFYTSYLLFFSEKLLLKMRSILVTTVGLVLSFYFYYYMAAGEYWVNCLRFLFIEVPADQFWYFGVYPVKFITTVFQFFGNQRFAFHFFIAVALLAYLIIRYRADKAAEKYGLIVLLLYGLFSTIPLLAIYSPQYYGAPLVRIDYLIIILLIGRKYIYLLNERAYIGMLLVSILAVGIFSYKDYKEVFPKPDKQYVYDAQTMDWRLEDKAYYSNKKYLGVYLSRKWEEHLLNIEEIINIEKLNMEDVSLWSTYTSIIEADQNTFHPYIDYIIHALGPIKRTQYTEVFKQVQPTFVRTDNEKVWVYGEWLRNEHWEFYKEVFSKYSLTYIDEQGVLWRRDNNQIQQQIISDYDTNFFTNNSFTLREIKIDNYKPDGIYSIKVKYTIENPYSLIPYISKVPRYFIYINNAESTLPISLPPYQSEFTFPVMPAFDGTSPTLSVKVESVLPGCSIAITRVTVEKITLPEKTMQYLYRSKEIPSSD